MTSSSTNSTASGEPRFATKPESPAETGIAQERSPEKPQADKPKEVALDASVLVDELLVARLSPEELDQGWIRLFDGQSMIGWKNTGSADWAVKDGELVANTGEPGLLVTQVR